MSSPFYLLKLKHNYIIPTPSSVQMSRNSPHKDRAPADLQDPVPASANRLSNEFETLFYVYTWNLGFH